MCGRFTLTVDPSELNEAFENYSFPKKFSPRFNIAPAQPVLAIPNTPNKKADFFLWGLIPSWSKDPSIANKPITATPVITISNINAHVGLKVWFNQLSMLFVIPDKLHMFNYKF